MRKSCWSGCIWPNLAARYIYRWLLFVLGLLGATIIAAGTVLFWIKRRQSNLREFGRATRLVYRVIETLNIAAITGLLVACLGFFWANRLLPMNLPDRAGWEITAFFAIWLVTAVHAALLPATRVWAQQYWLFAVFVCYYRSLIYGLPANISFITRFRGHGRNFLWSSAQ